MNKFKLLAFLVLLTLSLFTQLLAAQAQTDINYSFVTLDSIFARGVVDHSNFSKFPDQPYLNLIQSALKTTWDSTNIHSLDRSMTEMAENEGIKAQEKAYLYYTWSGLYKHDFIKQLDLLEKAIGLYQQLDDVEGQIHCLSDFAQISYDMTFFPDLSENQKQAYLDMAILAKGTTDPYALRRALHHQLTYAQLANQPFDRTELDSMYRTFEQFEDQVVQSDNYLGTYDAFTIAYWSIGDFKTAEKLVEMTVGRADPKDRSYAFHLYNYSYVKASLRDFASARKVARKAFESKPELLYSSDYSLAENIAYFLASMYEIEGDLDSAVFFHKEGAFLADGKYHFDLKTQREENEYRFGSRRKQLEVENLSLQKQSADQKSQIITLVSIIIAIGLIAALIFSRRLRTTNKKLKQLIASRDQLITIIGHDLRSPLKMYQGLAGSIDYLIKKKDWKRLHQVGSYIDQTGKDLDIMLNNMLHWGLQQENRTFDIRENIDLQHIVDQLISPFELSAQQKSISLTVRVQDDRTGIGDPGALSVILTNLLDNALKYGMHGTTIDLKTQIEHNQFSLLISNTATEESFSRLKVIVENESVMDSQNRLSAKGGFGWLLIKRLLNELSGKVSLSGSSERILLNINLPLSHGYS